MSESTSEMLAHAEQALRLGDQLKAALLLHKILLQDFTNHQAWLLLYSMRGKGQSLEEFQHSFAHKYYPQLAHLFSQVTASPVPIPEPTAPESNPTLPALGANAPELEPLPEEPELPPDESEMLPEELDILLKRFASRPSEPHLEQSDAPIPEPLPAELTPLSTIRRPYCPNCKKIFKPEVLFCDTCGAPLFQLVEAQPGESESPAVQPEAKPPETQPPQRSDTQPPQPAAPPPATGTSPSVPVAQPSQGEGSLLLFRRKSPILEDVAFSIWIDGTPHGEISNHQMLRITLPAGYHTIEVIAGDRTSSPVTIDIPPKGQLRMICRPVGTSPDIIKPELKIYQSKAAPAPEKVKHSPSLIIKIVLIFMLFLIFMVGIGVVALFLFQQGIL